jgi:hypothetical protein
MSLKPKLWSAPTLTSSPWHLKPKITIGLTGPARVGKTLSAELIAKIMIDNFGVHSAIISLADTLKDECAQATNIPRQWFDDPRYKETLRPLMQWWGTEFRRNPLLGGRDDYWTTALKQKYQSLPPAYEVLICPDVRFDNEAIALESFGEYKNFMIELVGENAPSTPHNGHISEKGVTSSYISVVITNDHADGVDALREQLEEWLGENLV